MAKKSKPVLTQTLLFWLSIFFMLVALFVVIMYYDQSQMVQQYLKSRTLQNNAVVKPTPSVSPLPKATVKPVKK